VRIMRAILPTALTIVPQARRFEARRKAVAS
jgi:hypothetical protein